MASDDIYRSRGRDGNPAGWTDAFYDGVRTRNTAQLDWLLRIPPAGGVIPSRWRDPVQDFAKHKQTLLQRLGSVPPILPAQWLPAWIASAEQLDMAAVGVLEAEDRVQKHRFARARAADQEVSGIGPAGERAGYNHRALRTRRTANKSGGRLQQSKSPAAYGHHPAAAGV